MAELGVRPAGVLRLGRRRLAPWQLLVMAVAPGPAAGGGQASSAAGGGQASSAAGGGQTSMAVEWVDSAVAEGADIVEVPSVAPFVATVRDAYPELIIAVRTGQDVAGLEACAAGADLLCGLLPDGLPPGVGVAGSPALAARAVAAGVAAERVIVEGSPQQVADLVASGWPVLVSLPESDLAGDLAGDLARDLARAAVFGWLGVRVFRVGRVRETRRALSMVSAIRGDRPPAYAVRGLA